MNAPQAAPAKNVITYDEVMGIADMLGAQHGLARDVQIKSLLKCLEGAYHGVLDLKKNKHGQDRDDATMFAERYFKARNGNVIFDPKADNQQKLASNVRTAIKLGTSPKFGNGEPLAIVNNLMGNIYQKERKTNMKACDDAANVFLKFAREQLKRDILLTDEELRQLCFKKPKEEATLEEYLEATAKKLDKLISGDAPGNLQCKTQNVVTARHAIRQELAAIAKAKGK